MPRPKAAMLITQTMQAACFRESDLERIRAVTDLRPAESDDLSPEAQHGAACGADILITGWGTHPLSPDMLDAAPNLRAMCHAAGSVKHLVIDVLDALQERGIRISSAASALAVGVAEFAFGMMLVSMKAVWPHVASTRDGAWRTADAQAWVREPLGATVGVVGASWVGREMIRLCQTLDLAQILLFDPYVSREEAARLGAVKVELDELMARSDVVSLHAPATEECRHLINAAHLALMKDHAIFVNTARGMCVDEAALIAELEKGRIWACLDVTDPEPPARDSPLRSLPNCILTPHIAGAIKENQWRQGERVAGEIERFAAGRPLRYDVRLEQLYRLA